MKRRTAVVFTLLPLWLLLVLLACNLTGSPEPPTLVPRATSTPPPTIGYATLAPNEYPQQATQINSNIARSDTTLLSVLNRVQPDRLLQHVDVLEGMRTRRWNSTKTSTTEGIGAAETYVRDQFKQIAAQSYQNSFVVQTQEFAYSWNNQDTTGTNIIGVMQGTEVGRGVVVIGAHYDSITMDYNNSTASAPGADDNASGVAALLEMAQIMSQRRHRATVIFVAFGAEEIQRQGSLAFVKDYIRARNIPVTAMLNMDIIGSYTGPDGDINDRQIRMYSADPNDSTSRQLARELHAIASRLAPDMEIDVQPAVDRAGRYSDHMSFSDVGYPAVRFVEALEEVGREHTERDTIDDIQISYLVGATKTILACLTSLADGPAAPQNIQLRENGDGLRTLVWSPVDGASSYVVALRPPGALTYSDMFESTETSVTWKGFVASSYGSLAIASKDANGLIGPFSFEFAITS